MSGRAEEDLRPVILTLDDSTPSSQPVIPMSIEERYRMLPTRSLQDYLLMGVLGPAARTAALAELARRGIAPPPEA
jgi:hypothetical protein